ncbi:polyketide synthase dehydratase domain-containing protein [Streptomyces sp. M19]
MTAAWRLDGDVYAEVALPDEQVAEARRFALHPALLDASLHALWLAARDGVAADGTPAAATLPFSWSG